jgi:hypothetical protein
MVEWSYVSKIIGWLKSAHSAVISGFGFFGLKSRVDDLERKLESAEKQQPIFRKCPQCGARDFRLQDHYRARPDFYGPRFLHEKWLCFNCGHREENNIQEPE